MNKLERYIYNRVRFNPLLKRSVTYLYQLVGSAVPHPKLSYSYPITVISGFFYGFHDKNPWSADDTKILAHRVTDPLLKPPIKDEIEVGFFNSDDFENFISLGKTRTWNWQMGSMLQWIGSSSKIIYNDFMDDILHARIIDSNGNELGRIKQPIAALDNQGRWGLSHSFTRMQKYAPAYAYYFGGQESDNTAKPDDVGLFLINLDSGDIKLILSLADIAAIPNHHFSDTIYHYLTHPLFSPTGDRFSFYHRWIDSSGRTWTRLFTCDIDGTNLHLFDTSGIVTHTAWKSDGELLAYCYKQDIGDHYYLLKDKSQDFKIIGLEEFSSDGHPQFTNDNTTFITDTYPDRNRIQKLISFDISKNEYQVLAQVKSPLKFRGAIRCDLHPRWNHAGSDICFDSCHTGTRSLCILRLK